MTAVDNRKAIRLLALLTAFLLAGCSPSNGGVGTITGKVANETGYRVAEAMITVDGTQLAAESDSDSGQFVIENVPAGTYSLRVSRRNFVDTVVPVTVKANQASVVTCRLNFDIPADTTPYAVRIYNTSNYTITLQQGTIRPGNYLVAYYPPGRHRVLVSIGGIGATERTLVVYQEITYIFFAERDGVFGFETH